MIVNSISGQTTGKLTGTVVDAETGEALIGVNVFLFGTNYGAATDIDGNYLIQAIPSGKYSLVFSIIGYAKSSVEEVFIEEGSVSTINFAMRSDSFEIDEVVVSAKLLENNEANLLIKRQKSNAVSDAISAEAISRSGSGNAADAVSKITGASVVDGKYVYIRGLGDRYSSTHLNGTELPSADPDQKSFNLDLFPSNLLDNLTTIKSFTPDKPGNFSGGLVDVKTKNYPDNFTFNISTSGSYNSNSNLNSEFLSYSGSSTDWLGYDNGSRNMPAVFNDPNLVIPSPNQARRDAVLAQQLNDLSRSFNTEMAPVKKSQPINQSLSISIGDQIGLFNQPFGYTASLSYSRDFSFYDNGTVGRWQLSGNYDQAEGLNKYMLLSDSKSSEEVLLGGMLNMAYKPHQFHDVAFRFLFTQSGETISRYQQGDWPNQLGDDGVYETYSLLYKERNLISYQFSGEHHLPFMFDSKLEWSGSYSKSKQNEPDLRFFSDDYQVQDDGSLFYQINKNSYNVPTRFFRNLEEDNFNFNLDFSIPFDQWDGLKSKMKFGGNFVDVSREFRERRFEFRLSSYEYNGDPVSFFEEQVGIVDDSDDRYLFGSYVYDASTARSNYDGTSNVGAAYAMIELPITRDLKLIGGVRLETTNMSVISHDANEVEGKLSNEDWLPSLNAIYSLTETMNLRASFGRTLARPSLRELAPFRSFEFLGDFQFIGNPGLERTLINNYDLRWEWFQRPGEIYAVSVFYKQFLNPIERAFDPTTELISYQNVDEGITYGAEFEFRHRLDFLHSSLSNFLLNMNFSVVYSEVNIPSAEFETLIQPHHESAENTRPLFGQSPYIVNLELSYINSDWGTSASLFYNIFGERLSEVTLGVTPDVYEQSRGMLDLILSQKIAYGFKLKFSAKNMLNSPVKKTIDFKDREYIYYSYNKGRSFSLGLSYSL